MRRIPIVVLSLALLIGLSAPASGQAPEKTHPLTIHDMLAMDRISDSQVSPDGKWIAFTVRETDLAANRGRTDIWLVGTDGKGLRRLTNHPAADFNGRWTPCSQWIFFLSTRSGSSQIWRIKIDGGEAEQMTRLPLDVGNLLLAKAKLAFTMDVFPGLTPEATAAKLEAIEKDKATGRLYDKLFVRHWDTWSDGRRSHLFFMPMHGGGEAKDLMPAMDADTPNKPFGGTEEIAFTPDGKGLVFAAKDVGREEAWSTDSDLYYVPIDGSAAPRCLTEANKAMDTLPAFSPDGKTLAYVAMARPGYEADRYRIVLRDWPDGTAARPDRGLGLLGRLARLGQGRQEAPGHGAQQGPDLALRHRRRDRESGHARRPRHRGRFRPSGRRRRLRAQHPDLADRDLFHRAGRGREGPDARSTRAKVAAVRMGEPEQFSFKGWNNETVYGYIVKPVDFDAAKKYPVAFMIHGGPQGSFGNDFHYRWNPQAYAGAGYAAVMVDFHGSTGYGQAFCDSIRGDWGGKPLEDLKKGLAAALAKYPWMDGTRVGALGASYGGYMINWIAGNWPDRFKCLIAHDGNIDERAAYFETEELWFPEWDHMGTPWDNPKNYEKHNPANFIKNWKTPMLVVHGGQDFRVVETQGIGSFNVLQRRGIPSKFLYFPDENHWVLKPANSILWHETVIGWLDKWLK